MSTISYSVYSIIASSPASVDLSAAFLTPSVANPSYDNVSWELVIEDEGTSLWQGGVNPDGSLAQGNAPAGFIHPGSVSCNGNLMVRVNANPNPDKRCSCSGDPSGCASCSSSDTSGNSVELATGNFVFEKELLSLAGVGNNKWSFGLNYKSNFDIDGLLGKGFAYPQYMHLEFLGRSSGAIYQFDVQVVTNQLSRAVFINNGSGIFTPLSASNNSGCTLKVINQFSANEEYILTAADGTVTTFYGFNYYNYLGGGSDRTNPAQGQIKSIKDRNGNLQTFVWGNTSSFEQSNEIVYDGVAQLTQVIDSYGREINYSYYGSEGGYCIKQITDSLGRQLNFQYDTEGHLIAVVTPSILKATPGNTFPGGTAYVFQYDVDNLNPARRDDLIKIWYPNQTLPYLNTDTRTVDVNAVYAQAMPRYQVTYGQSLYDLDSWGKVLTETLGDSESGVGGVASFAYTTCASVLPDNLIDPDTPIISRTTYTDRNGNVKIYDFNAGWTVSRMEVDLNRNKNSLELNNEANGGNATPPFVTWTQFDPQTNLPLAIVYPEGNSVAYSYDDGMVDSVFYPGRLGLRLTETRLPTNSIGISSRTGSNGQEMLTKSYFYDPLFNQLCAVIDERGNPISASGSPPVNTYFTPQNGGTTPTDLDRSRYATTYTFDYQKDTATTVENDTNLWATLGLNPSTAAAQITSLLTNANTQMIAGGLPLGFPMALGDVNGDGTGNGASSGLPDATHLGNKIRTVYPAVLQVDGSIQNRVQLFTNNLRGQETTTTDPEGNITVTIRYPENDPEGSGQNISSTLSVQQYGLVREIHRDANPDDVMSLVGASGDLVDFVPGLITRTNTSGVYQDLVTRYEGSSSGSAGCVTCGYDAMGNVLNETDPRGFTTIYDRNEMGEIYRVTSPAPYNFRVETSYDANRNVIQVDTEDLQVQYNSPDPTSSGYGTFTPSGSGTTAHVPMVAGPGGAVRPGWFSNLMSYDFLDDKIEDDIDATGSLPANLVTKYQYDPNQNLIKIIKPEGNTVEYDYDERDLKIAERVGYFLNPDDPTDPQNSPGAVTAYSYDGNKNLLNVIGPVNHNSIGGATTSNTVYIVNAFGSGSMLTLKGDWVLANTYDGFDRVVVATDAVGGVVNLTYDPTSTLIQKQIEGQIGGATPTNRSGFGNQQLSNRLWRYDEALRLYEDQQDVFLPTNIFLPSSRTVTQIGGGLAANSTANDHTGTVTLASGGTPSYVLTRNVYDRSGRIAIVLADNTAQTSYAYDGANRQILTTDPLGNTVATEYDGNANPVKVTRTEVCTITTPAVANEIFISFTWFDCLNRPVVTGTQGADGCLTSNLNLCCPWQGLPSTLYSLLGYDSRGNKTSVTDPKLNVIVSVYDGASRLIETQQEMRQNGDGRNAPARNQTFLTAGGGIIRTEYVYDANSRLVELVDDRGASTVYTYDMLDRLVTKTLADGSVSTRSYDLSSCLVGYTDENGSVFAFLYDALSRKSTVNITLASGVGGTTSQLYYYDGLNRIVFANQYYAPLYPSNQLFYDSLGRLIEDSQNARYTLYTTHTQWTSLVPTQITYPGEYGPDTPDITLTNVYDALYRRTSMTGTSVTYGAIDAVAWQYFGPSRVVETNYGTGSLICTQMNNARTHSAVQTAVPLPAWGNISADQLGYDGAGRMMTKRYLTGGISGSTHGYANTTALAGYTTSFDRASNKLYERHLEAESRSHLYQPYHDDGNFAVGYDSANRLLQYQRGVLSSAIIPYRVPAGASVATPITLPGTDQVRTYGLDGLGNWKTSNFTEVGSGGSTTNTAESRSHNYVNEITSIRDTTGGTAATTPFVYDKNGNLLNDGVRIYQYDAFNRLILVTKVSGGTVVGTYIYDAFNRRVQKTVSNGGFTGDIPNGSFDYFYDGQQIIEERDDSTEEGWLGLYFWGQYIDELLFFTKVSGGSSTNYRVLSDLLYRSTAIVTTSNVITEAYDTDAYGNTLCYSGPGTDGHWFTDDDARTNNPINTTIFTGRQYDPESQIYYYRARYYVPTMGRFISRDPLGSPLMMVDVVEPSGSPELSQGPNLYWYVQNRPVNRVDPLGLVTPVDLIVGTLVVGGAALAYLAWKAYEPLSHCNCDDIDQQIANANAAINALSGNSSDSNLSQLGLNQVGMAGVGALPGAGGTPGGAALINGFEGSWYRGLTSGAAEGNAFYNYENSNAHQNPLDPNASYDPAVNAAVLQRNQDYLNYLQSQRAKAGCPN